MKFFKCEDCGEIFDTPDTMQDLVGEFWGSPAYQTIAICPHCKSDEIFETEECDDSGILKEIELEEPNGDYVDYVVYTSDWYYDNCHGKCLTCKFHDIRGGSGRCMWEVLK